jgi:hypothetical protein
VRAYERVSCLPELRDEALALVKSQSVAKHDGICHVSFNYTFSSFDGLR